MDVNGLIEQLQNLAGSHPYLALAILLFVAGALIRGKAALIFYVLGSLAMLKSFGLVDTFFSFLKDVPGMLKDMISVFGGG